MGSWDAIKFACLLVASLCRILIKSKKMEQQIKLLLERMNALETRVKKN